MDDALDALIDAGWSFRTPFNIVYRDNNIMTTPINAIETRWRLSNGTETTYFTSLVGPDECDYVLNKVASFFNNSRLDG